MHVKLSDALENVGFTIAYYPKIAKWLGSVGDAIFLCQLWYWHDKGNSPDGWIYKTQKEFEEETALGRYEQEHARRKLKSLGILEEERRGVPARLYYRLDVDRMNELWEEWYQKQEEDKANKNVANEQSSLLDCNNQVCGKVANKNVEKWQSITENTTDTTTEITKERKEYKEKKESRKSNDLLFTVEEKKKADKELEMFNAFWKAYPKKQKRAVALKCWQKLKVDDELFAEIMAGLDRLKQSRQWREQDGKFIPMPSTFLNERRWEDEPEVDKQALVQKSNVLEEQRVKRVYELTPEHPPFHDDIGNTLKWMELVKEWEAKYGMTFQEWEDKNGPLREYMRKHYGRG